jgi:hypothetical protein
VPFLHPSVFSQGLAAQGPGSGETGDFWVTYGICQMIGVGEENLHMPFS